MTKSTGVIPVTANGRAGRRGRGRSPSLPAFRVPRRPPTPRPVAAKLVPVAVAPRRDELHRRGFHRAVGRDLQGPCTGDLGRLVGGGAGGTRRVRTVGHRTVQGPGEGGGGCARRDAAHGDGVRNASGTAGGRGDRGLRRHRRRVGHDLGDLARGPGRARHPAGERCTGEGGDPAVAAERRQLHRPGGDVGRRAVGDGGRTRLDGGGPAPVHPAAALRSGGNRADEGPCHGARARSEAAEGDVVRGRTEGRDRRGRGLGHDGRNRQLHGLGRGAGRKVRFLARRRGRKVGAEAVAAGTTEGDGRGRFVAVPGHRHGAGLVHDSQIRARGRGTARGADRLHRSVQGPGERIRRRAGGEAADDVGVGDGLRAPVVLIAATVLTLGANGWTCVTSPGAPGPTVAV